MHRAKCVSLHDWRSLRSSARKYAVQPELQFLVEGCSLFARDRPNMPDSFSDRHHPAKPESRCQVISLFVRSLIYNEENNVVFVRELDVKSPHQYPVPLEPL